ncbi:MAG: MFS transporter [Asticcacaulis sp.]|uniref:MFS transporter n=1 Tax=Asticcacaulis sp. TaxID=1872648 RepID=UPI0039E2FE00
MTTFRALKNPNYRIWATGAAVSNVGTWLQRTAQDWIVLTLLTAHSAKAVGIVMALQFGPQAVLLPFTGYAADRFDRRKLLIVTQAIMGTLAAILGVLTLTGLVQLWHVYVLAGLLGVVTAFDTPARQIFVTDLVPVEELSNAVALNSASFNAARLVGPAVAGVLIALVGSGWVFLINAASFFGVLISLIVLRASTMQVRARRTAKSSFAEGFRYIGSRPDLMAIMLMFFLIGTFGLNYPIFISTMAVKEFHKGVGQFGLLTSILAIGSVSGALLSASRSTPRLRHLLIGSACFGLGSTFAAIMPDYWTFGAALIMIGISAQTFSTSANGLVQMSTESHLKGRVQAIMMAVFNGGTPLGAPIVGWVADRFGPRWGIMVAAFGGFGAAAIILHYFVKHRGLSLHIEDGRLQARFKDKH